MSTYNNYLEQQGYAQSTIVSHQRQLKHFKTWCKTKNTTVEMIDYKACLKYIKHLKGKGNSPKTVNHKLANLKTYFNYLIKQSLRSDNPIEHTALKGVKRTINYNLLEGEELEDLYYSFQSNNEKENHHKDTAKRTKVMIGLIVYQGLNTTDLSTLKIEHVQLSKGKIYVPAAKRSNARTLELKPWQIIELMEYLDGIRPRLQDKLDNYSDQLFPSNARFTVITSQLIKKLKKTNHQVKDIKQIRASVITNWLKQYNLRKVQYMAGHRYISSTEKYVQDDLENLHEMVNNFHPIN